jgi:hypothetical protein
LRFRYYLGETHIALTVAEHSDDAQQATGTG